MEGSDGAINAIRAWISEDYGSLLFIAAIVIFGAMLVFAVKDGGAISEWVKARPRMRELKRAEEDKTAAVTRLIGNRKQRRALSSQERRKGGR